MPPRGQEQCPYCGQPVKRRQYDRHLRRVHGVVFRKVRLRDVTAEVFSRRLEVAYTNTWVK